MKRDFRSSVRVLTVIALTAAVGMSSAQTPEQMEYERQQREYWRQQERQRQQQQQQQQLMNENARRQQEQSAGCARLTPKSPGCTDAKRGFRRRIPLIGWRRSIGRTGGVGCARNVGEAPCAAARPQSPAG